MTQVDGTGYPVERFDAMVDGLLGGEAENKNTLQTVAHFVLESTTDLAFINAVDVNRYETDPAIGGYGREIFFKSQLIAGDILFGLVHNHGDDRIDAVALNEYYCDTGYSDAEHAQNAAAITQLLNQLETLKESGGLKRASE
jgi:hypothetical protein